MSTTIDQKVVEMKFDNSNFEKNVSTTISTLDKLKAALHLDKAGKGLDEVNKASENNKIGKLGEAAETVSQKFSALQAIATGALMKIGSQAISTGERLLKSITFDQIEAGYKKYEEKTQAVQTIMAGTGKSATEVNEALQKLIWFADETSYSFTDMTSNIAKFTAQGVDLEVAETAMQGISTWAAISGKNTQAAEHAMYNLAQALGTGAVKLQDWKSITNVNMDTVEFKKTVLETAAALGELEKEVDSEGLEHYFVRVGAKAKKTEVSVSDFTSTMKEGWFTSEVLLKVLGKYGEYSDGLYEVYETLADLGPEYSKTTSEIISDMEKLHGADDDTILNAGYTKDLIPLIREMSNEYDGLGARAFKAAQEAITFSQAIDATKDAVSSQWMTTFEYIFGDIKQAREMWTDLANDLWDIFAAGGENRNIFLGYLDKNGALNNFREGVIRSFRNILNIIEITRDAFSNVFSGPSADAVVEISRRFDRFTRSIEITDNVIAKLNGEYVDLTYNEQKVYNVLSNLKSGFEGLLSVLKIGTTVIKSFVKIIATIAGEVVPNLNLGILDVVGNMGEFLKVFSESTINKIEEFTDSICDFIKSIKDMPVVQQAADYVHTFVQNFKNAVSEFSKINIDFRSELEKIGLVLAQFFNPSDMNTINLERLGLKTLQEYLKDFTGNEKVVAVANNIQNAFTHLFESIKSFKMPSMKDNMFNFLKEFALGLSAEGLYGGFRNSINYIRNIFTTKVVKLKDSFLMQLYEIGKKIGPLMTKAFNALIAGFTLLKKFIFGTKEITIESIADIGRKVAALVLLIKAINVFDGIGDILENISDSIGNIGKAMKFNAVSSIIKSVALLLVAIAASLAIIGNIEAKDAWRGVGILTVMSVIMGGVVLALSKLTSSFSGTLTGGIKDVANLLGLALVLGALAGAILALIKSVKDFGSMNTRELERGLIGVIGVIGALAIATMAVARTCRGGSALSTGIILAFILGLQKVLDVIKEYNTFPWEENTKGIQSMIGMMVVLAACMRLMSTKIGKDQKAASNTYALLVFVLSLRILLKGVEQLGGMPVEQMKQGIRGITILIGVLTACIFAINKSSSGGALNKGQKSINQFKGIATALLGLCIAIVVLGNLPLRTLIQGGLAVAACLTVLGLFVRLTAVGDQVKLPKLLSIFIAAGLLIAEIGYFINKLAPLGGDNVLKACEGFGLVLGSIAGAMLALALVGKIKMDAKAGKNLVLTGLVMGVITAILVPAMIKLIKLLEGVNAEGAIPKIVAITALMASVAALTLATIGISRIGFAPDQALIVEGLMVGMLIVIAFASQVMKAVSGINPEGAIAKIGALTLLLGAMSLVLLAAIGIGAIVAAGGLALVGGTAGAMVGLLIVSGITAIVAQIIKSLNGVDGTNAIANVQAISLMLGVMSGVLIACALIGVLSVPAFVGVILLFGFIKEFTRLLDSIGAIANNTNLVANVKMASEVMGLLGEAIGNFVGGIVAGTIEAIGSVLPKFGQDLGDFYTNAEPFFNGVAKFSQSSADGMKKLAEALLALTVTSLINGITNFLTIGHSLTNLGTDLSSFWTSSKTFFDGVSTLSPDVVQAADNVAKLLITLTKAELLNGIKNIFSLLTGGISFSSFGLQLSMFGLALTDFSNSVKDVDADALNKVVPIIDDLVRISSTIENSGGLLAGITGDNTFAELGNGLDDFGKVLYQFGAACKQVVYSGYGTAINETIPVVKSLIKVMELIPNTGLSAASMLVGDNSWKTMGKGFAEFGDALKTFGLKCQEIIRGGYEQYIEGTIPVIRSLAKVLDIIPNSGLSMASTWVGDNTWASFGTGLADFGTALKDYGDAVSNMDAEAVINSVPAVQALAEVSNILPNYGGLIQLFAGENDWWSFASGLSKLGEGIADFGKSVEDPDIVTMVGNGVEAIKKLAEVNTLVFDTATLTQVGQSINTFSADFSAVAANLLGGGFDYTQLPIVATSIKDLVDALSDLSGVDKKGMSLLTQAIAELGTTAITELANGISANSGLAIGALQNMIKQMIQAGDNSKPQFLRLGSDFNIQIISGLRANMGMVRQTLVNGVTTAVSGARNKYQEFYSAGQFLVDGFVAGMDSKISSAATKAAQMAKEAYDAAMAALDAHSPSRLMMEVGGYFAEGFSNGIEQESGMSSSAASSMATEAVSAAAGVVGSLSSAVGSQANGFKQVGFEAMKYFGLGIQEAVPTLELPINGFVAKFVSMFTLQVPKAQEVMKTMLNAMVNTVISMYTTFSSEGMYTVNKFIEGIRSRSYYINTIWVSALNSSVSSIRNNRDNFNNAASYLVDGFIIGIENGIPKVQEAAAKMAKEAYDAAMAALNAHSPSRLFMAVGGYVGQGFIIGMDSYDKESAASGARLAVSAIDAVNELIEDGVDVNPVISPVLDLTKVADGTKKLNSMLSKSQAMTISASMNQNGTSNGGTVRQEQQSQSTTFIQNNYSPKALSRIDIYRQTENQLLAVRG